jgi:uroporphyrinogen III methyltransferase/synthase
MTGRVALVGAGPGDPSLLTVRAVELLRAADVVAHDELVSEAILAMVPGHAELLAVGRRRGLGDAGHRLHPEVLARARAGQAVVRLKAGDPLVFGRGGEEADELARAGIPFEIVPGITAAVGAAAYSGIPLTHRDVAAELVIATGHRAGGASSSREARAGQTLALYMAAHELAVNLAALVRDGWPPSTPAALVIAATTADERTVTATVATLAAESEALRRAMPKLPALVLVGDVVRCRASTEWRTRLPLRGRRVLVARVRSAPSRVTSELRSLGAEVMDLPHVPARWPSRLDLVVLASASSAHALYASAPGHVREVPALAIGARTAQAARSSGVRTVVRAHAGTTAALVESVVRACTPASSRAPSASPRSVSPESLL